jgi:restriction endonuclease S subunit
MHSLLHGLLHCLLKDMVTIRSGRLFRGKIEPDPIGHYQVIQIGDIDVGRKLSYQDLTRINLPDIKPSQLVQKGDVLFISRGMRKHAVAIIEELNNVITTSQIFILRPSERLLPEYLAWYLNQLPAQRYLEEHSSGTNVSLINMEAFGKLPVRAPKLDIQQKIVRISELSVRERELAELILKKRSALIEMSLLAAIERKI